MSQKNIFGLLSVILFFMSMTNLSFAEESIHIEALEHPEYGNQVKPVANTTRSTKRFRNMKNHPQPCDRFNAKKFRNINYQQTREEDNYFKKNNCPLGSL